MSARYDAVIIGGGHNGLVCAAYLAREDLSFNLSGRSNEGPVFDKPYSDATARQIDEEVKAIIEEVRQRARNLLEEKRAKLDEIAHLLLQKEVIGPKDLVEILGARPYGDYVTVNGRDAETVAYSEKTVEREPAAGRGVAGTSVPDAEAGGDGMNT